MMSNTNLYPLTNLIIVMQFSDKFLGRSAFISGFGLFEEEKRASTVLRYASVRVTSYETCREFPSFDPAYHLCVEDPVHDACEGDGGGKKVIDEFLPNEKAVDDAYLTWFKETPATYFIKSDKALRTPVFNIGEDCGWRKSQVVKFECCRWGKNWLSV